MMNFNKLNDEANYYSELSGKTGNNCWNQDKFQEGMFEMIKNLNLSKKQLLDLLDSMVNNDEELDMAKKENQSKYMFQVYLEDQIKLLNQDKDKGMSKVA